MPVLRGSFEILRSHRESKRHKNKKVYAIEKCMQTGPNSEQSNRSNNILEHGILIPFHTGICYHCHALDCIKKNAWIEVGTQAAVRRVRCRLPKTERHSDIRVHISPCLPRLYEAILSIDRRKYYSSGGSAHSELLEGEEGGNIREPKRWIRPNEIRVRRSWNAWLSFEAYVGLSVYRQNRSLR